MEFNFSKMEGLGNDFVVFDDRDLKIGNKFSYNELSVKLCDRHFGVGADGLIVVLNSTTHDIKYRIFNPDGSEPQMCGNGMRCFAKFVYENKIVQKEVFTVETLAGTIIPKVNVNEKGIVETVRVDMGQPVLEAKKVPFISNNERAVSEEIEIDGVKLNVTAVSMGNPHAVFFVDKATDYLVRNIGSQKEIFEKQKAYFHLPKTWKISIQFKTKDTPSALYKCLWAFATRHINLTKIESLPARENRFEYIFWIDLEKSGEEKVIFDAFEELQFFCKDFKILWEY